MAEKLPDGVVNLDDYRNKVEPATNEGQYEDIEGGDYQAEKAQASLEVAKILKDAEFPDDDFEMLLASDQEKLNSLRESLYGKMEELALDESGKVQNENRFMIELIGQRLAVLDELLNVRSSENKAEELFTKKEAV